MIFLNVNFIFGVSMDTEKTVCGNRGDVTNE